MTFSATYFGSSGWLIDLGKIRVLIDPWLTGRLSFPPGPWLIEGRLTKKLDVPKGISLILLSQGLADHAHPPSLDLLSKSIPVVGSKSAASVVKELGFKTIFELKPGEVKIVEGLKIEASEGAFVPNVENGYLLSNDFGSLYYEPHGFLDKKISARRLDAVITPVVNLKLPIVGDFIKGKKILPELIKRFQPFTVLASTTGGDSIFTGILNKFITLDDIKGEELEIFSEKTFFIDPVPGKSYSLKSSKEGF
tara:strand:- start:38 stop:790 length:753 start_codon:yes stop_codon:yes gene_type:complete